MAKPIPEGCHTLTAHIVVKNAAKAIDFYKRAFGATEISRMAMGDKIGHAELRIGDSVLMLADEWPGYEVRSPESIGATTFSMHVYFEDVDAMYQQAVAAGAKGIRPPEDQFWGDRYGMIVDPFGHSWGLATHIKDVSHEECQRAMDAMMSKTQAQHG